MHILSISKSVKRH